MVLRGIDKLQKLEDAQVEHKGVQNVKQFAISARIWKKLHNFANVQSVQNVQSF